MWPRWGWGGVNPTEHEEGQQPRDPWGGGGWEQWAPWFAGGGNEFPGPEWVGGDKTGQARLNWFAQMLPYLQAFQQSQQWGSEFDWRKEMDQWSQGFQGGQFDWQKEQDRWSRGLQESMFGWEQEQGKWGQQFQEQQLDWQKQSETARLQQESEAANLAAFGRRWKPSTRWT